MKNKKSILIIIIGLVIFTTILVLVTLNLTQSFDNGIYTLTAKIMNPLLTPFVILITLLGNPLTVIAIMAYLIYILRKNKNYYLPLIDALLTSYLVNTLIKVLVARPRPEVLKLIEQDGYSFPSGHAMNSMAIYFMLFLLINHYMKKSVKKTILLITTMILPILIGLSRIYVGVHYATDVIAGWVLGLTIAYATFILWDKFKHLLEHKKDI